MKDEAEESRRMLRKKLILIKWMIKTKKYISIIRDTQDIFSRKRWKSRSVEEKRPDYLGTS